MKKNIVKFFLLAILLVVGIWCAYKYMFAQPQIAIPQDVDTKKWPIYNIGDGISFLPGGNSEQYAKQENGWYQQEEKQRYIKGKNAIIRAYIPGGENQNLRVKVSAVGVFAPEKMTQRVDVYANGHLVRKWDLNNKKNTYVADIDAEIMTDSRLELTFEIKTPYMPDNEKRALGMGVTNIKITKPFAMETKRKISRWLKSHL